MLHSTPDLIRFAGAELWKPMSVCCCKAGRGRKVVKSGKAAKVVNKGGKASAPKGGKAPGRAAGARAAD